MSERPTRREFLRWTAGSLAGLGLAPFLAPARGAREGALPSLLDPRPASDGSRGPGEPVDDGLPPRAVGLRSLGGDFAFDPVGLRLEPGARLTWLNMGDFHTTSAFHPDNADLLGIEMPSRIPEGAEPWHSGMLGLDAGTEFSHAFELPGVYDYFCQPHYSFGMVGRVVVTSPDGPSPDARPASELNEASRTELPSVGAILGDVGRTYEWSARINGVLLLRVHGEGAGGPAERMASRMAEDPRLGGMLERAGHADRVFSSLGRFVDAARSEPDYERLLELADAAKSSLSSAADALP